MHINWEGIITGTLGIIALIQKWLPIFAQKVMPIILEIEKRSKETGKLGPEDKKAIAMKALTVAQESGSLKLNWIERLIVSKVIDIEARRLPDIAVSKETIGIINDAVAEIAIDKKVAAIRPPDVPTLPRA